MARIGSYVDPGFILPVFQQRYDCRTIILLYFSARRSCVMILEIPGSDEGTLEDRRRTMLPRGKWLVARYGDYQNNKRGISLARTSVATRETW